MQRGGAGGEETPLLRQIEEALADPHTKEKYLTRCLRHVRRKRKREAVEEDDDDDDDDDDDTGASLTPDSRE